MQIYFDFAFLLTVLVLFTGIISLLDLMWWAKKRKGTTRKTSKLIEYSRSFFPLLLLVWAIRSFVIQPYKVPSGSLAPTILPGDFIVLNQFSYGLKIPATNIKFVSIAEPKRGDIALFHWPERPNILFIKRVVGVPGDRITYRNKVLWINDQIAEQRLIGKALDVEPSPGVSAVAQEKEEDLLGIKHHIFIRDTVGRYDHFDVIVPPNHYFMMGDNRDDSDDSRDWGFVPEANLVGKALIIWFSFDSENHNVRWGRIGQKIK